MALVNVKNFGEALKISGGTIRSKISRGQLLRNKLKLIDTENPTNYIYLLEVNGGDQSVFDSYNIKHTVKTKATSATVNKTKIVDGKKYVKKDLVAAPTSENIRGKKQLPKIENQTKLSLEEKREVKSNNKSNHVLFELELRQKTANAEYKEREAELKQIQLEKIAGNTLPLDLVDTILTINLQTIFKVFSSELENIATISVEILGGSREDLVRITNSQNVILNKLVETAKTNANFEINRAVEEYSEVRARGERK